MILAAQAQEPPHRIIAFRGAKLYTCAGTPIESGVLVLDNGRILSVGKDVPIPPGAAVEEVTGKVIIPGLIDAASRLFLDPGERASGAADQSVLDGLDLYQPDWREALDQGVTTVYVGPPTTGVINGLGAVLHLDGTPTVLQKDAALKLTLGASGGESSTALERYQSYPQLKQAFESARQYAETWDKYRRDLADVEQKKKEKKEDVKEPAKPRTVPGQDVLLRALDPKQPLRVRIEAHTADAIGLALRLIEEFKLRAVLEYATEGSAAAGPIAKAGIPVVVGPVFRLGPSSVDYQQHSVGTAAALVKAGIPVAIGSFGDERAGLSGPGGSRFLAESAALAASRGLSPAQALSAITIEAARILGIEKTHGSLEAGKAADLAILSGEPFEAGTRVERTLVNGAPVRAGRSR
jgi:imidazolonepropionase-like amidohydrolase